MATIKIADLPRATTVEDTDLLILDQTDDTKKIQIKDLMNKTDLVKSATLKENTGAGLIGTTSGNTVQKELDAKATTESLQNGGLLL